MALQDTTQRIDRAWIEGLFRSGLEAQEHLFLDSWGGGDDVSPLFGDALDGEDLLHG